jgi:asparagine synthase (glutamine-hydrolysing)
MAEAYLVKIDRSSMLASLEMRAPFLDHKLVEFAFGRVPDSLRATSKKRKVLLRCLAQKLLPADYDLDRKQGFSLPLDSWFDGAWGHYVKEVLSEADSQLFDQVMIQELIAGQQRGRPTAIRAYYLRALASAV